MKTKKSYTRITVTIPAEVLAKLQPVKNRINISATCAVAIEAAIEKELISISTAARREQELKENRRFASSHYT